MKINFFILFLILGLSSAKAQTDYVISIHKDIALDTPISAENPQAGYYIQMNFQLPGHSADDMHQCLIYAYSKEAGVVYRAGEQIEIREIKKDKIKNTAIIVWDITKYLKVFGDVGDPQVSEFRVTCSDSGQFFIDQFEIPDMNEYVQEYLTIDHK
jgi:hypothetical protein